ncbi:MAG: hypothetical protein A3E87_02225 [Gammaproteobacteria bacterium RIFCSPHIGHO2_12_FULL_35_23]|nr:MAG: hypothetical protein A3E87_02225 [Gammaproteobacteria bacterium RIFCSPHIGHO2_12_FULL_35_23]
MPITYSARCTPAIILEFLQRSEAFHKKIQVYSHSLLPITIKNTVNAHSDALYRASTVVIDSEILPAHIRAMSHAKQAAVGDEIDKSVIETLAFLLGTIHFLEEEVKQFAFLATFMSLPGHTTLIEKSKQQLEDARELLTEARNLGLEVDMADTWSRVGQVTDEHQKRMKAFNYFQQHRKHQPMLPVSSVKSRQYCTPCNFFAAAVVGFSLLAAVSAYLVLSDQTNYSPSL